MTSGDNPLLRLAFPLDFNQFSADDVGPGIDALIEVAGEAIGAIANAPEVTFESVMLALEDATLPLDRAISMVSHLESVATTDALRIAYAEAQPKVSAFFASIPLNDALWRKVKAFSETEEMRGLTGPKKRLTDKTVRYFRRHGADLPPSKKQDLSKIDVELTKCTIAYGQNVLDATNAFELLIEDEARLAGLPDNAKAAAAATAEAKGKKGFLFTLKAPSVIPVLTYLDDAEIRRTIYTAYTTRAAGEGVHNNRDHVATVLRLRHEKAELLGYKNFADLVTEERMAKSGDRAADFIADLRARTQSAFERETAALVDFAKKHALISGTPLNPWDVGYVSEKQRKARYDFDGEALRPYFSFDAVMEGLFKIAGRLYGLAFEPWTEASTWHDSVLAYRVLDAASSRWVAGIYIDPFPRDSKQGGAWMNGIWTGIERDDPRHLGLIVANVTPPAPGSQALLNHQEVETMFHEFGHLMHHCLTATEFRSQAGTNVAWDFVELPSQVFENWCWERDVLDLFAKHHETGDAIPDDLFAAMSKARTYRGASGQMRQLGFAQMDLALHRDFDSTSNADPVAFSRKIIAEHSPAGLPPEHATVAAFPHVFGSPTGYAAGYYSYKWAEVLDADAFSRFREEGLLNAKVGAAFRDAILKRGDEADAAALYRDFMGRDPLLEPLLKRLGIADEARL